MSQSKLVQLVPALIAATGIILSQLTATATANDSLARFAGPAVLLAALMTAGAWNWVILRQKFSSFLATLIAVAAVTVAVCSVGVFAPDRLDNMLPVLGAAAAVTFLTTGERCCRPTPSTPQQM